MLEYQVTKVQWWAAEDERTCETCGANHEKEYDIDKAPILPCHPGCRCTWLPVIDDGLKKIDILDVNSSANKQKNDKLVKFTNDSLSIPKVNLKGLDYNTTKNLLNIITDVYNKYPELNGTIEEIVQTNSASMAVGIVGRYDNFILAISSKVYSNPTKAQAAMRRMIDVGKFAKGTTIETIPYHEFGHMFEGVYIQRNYSNNDMEKVWDDCLAATEILKQASVKCYNDANRYKTELLSISEYALESDSEGLAECVHLEMTNRGSVFTNIVMKILRGK